MQAESTTTDLQAAMEKKKKRQLRKYMYRGVDLEQLLDMTRFFISSKTFYDSNNI